MTMSEFSNILGITGVILIVGAYFMTQLERVTAKDLSYLLANLIGALLITVSLLYHWNLASFVIEMFWISISLYGLHKWHSIRRRSSNNN